jgi:hypothetical protein
MSKCIADTDAVVVQALIASVCGLIGYAIHAQFLPIRQMFEGGKRGPMLGDCHAEGTNGIEKTARRASAAQGAL